MKQLNSNKAYFPWFDKILVEVYGESNERQLCSEIGFKPRFLSIGGAKEPNLTYDGRG